jgi:DNA-binding NarL/FixJ family response regulator
VVIADDSLLVRRGLASLLIEHGDDVVAEAGDADAAIAATRTLEPDVVILDIRMPPTHSNEGLVAAKAICATQPEVAVLILSSYIEAEFAVELVGSYPRRTGYLLKDNVADPRILNDTLLRLTKGECVIDPSVVAQCMRRRAMSSELDVLSEREREVLAALAEGRSNAGIGSVLFVAERTVETHITQIFMKLGLENEPTHHRRVLAVLAFLRATDITR